MAQTAVPTPGSAPVVRLQTSSGSLGLNEALARLARDPRDAQALIDAGKAALGMGDIDAAIGFFNRADAISPGHAEIKAGLARALIRNENPFDAIAMFEAAEKAGATGSELVADRGLAYDLVSDNLTAQKYYRQALALGANDEINRRLALSYAIAGNRASFEETLSPLLRRQDSAAWRTRAFALAILGDVDGAVAIANQSLSADLAGAIAPYLRFVPRLTPAQQAAAANFGHFPRASEIGRDDPRVAAFAPKSRPQVAAADAALVPRGEPLGRNARRARDERQVPRQSNVSPGRTRSTFAAATRAQAAPVAPSVPTVPAPAGSPVIGGSSASVEPADPGMVAVSAGTAPIPAQSDPPAPPRLPPPVSETPVSGQAAPSAAAQVAMASPPESQPAERTAPVVPAPRRSLTEAFADFGRPSTAATPAAGAVDIRSIAPPRPKPQEAARPAPPSHPSRIWVQVATGRDKAALGHDWRRLARQAESAFRGKAAMVSAWGQTNRLLAGPFSSEAAANAFIAQLRREGIDGTFRWTSPAGQVVDALKLK